jgi:16S rRNA (uracil1498-N3)-methyltransferase
MYNFFAQPESRCGDAFIITGSDYNHIRNVLRMKAGDRFLVSCGGESHLCALSSFDEDSVTAAIVEEHFQSTELGVELYLFQGLPKSDKLELIIQKTVELGVSAIIPVEMKRCVVKLEEKKKKSRRERWQAIAESAAKQSKRSLIPEVGEVLSYQEAIRQAGEMDLFLLPYENERGMAATREALEKIRPGSRVAILIGPEGGFDPREVALAQEHGAACVSLGQRILRTETAAITAVGMCMLHVEMNMGGETA